MGVEIYHLHVAAGLATARLARRLSAAIVIHCSHLAVTNTKLNAAAQGPMAARLSAPSRPTYPVSTRDRQGSMRTAPSVGRASAKICLSKTCGRDTPMTAEFNFFFARALFRTYVL